MGIQHLWSILKDAKLNQETSLNELMGKKLSVDFSTMLVDCMSMKMPAGVKSGENRSVYYRILNLMYCGITPVFVLDSEKAPDIKKRKRGEEFHLLNGKWKELLEAMGFPVISAPGEAEKTCALLNCKKLVDGCLTNDGDAFAYGALTVLKDYTVGNKDKIERYDMSEIEKKLGLNQRNFVALALLAGCEYDDGVTGAGEKKFCNLIQEIKKRLPDSNDIPDILARMRSWRTNDQLITLDEEKKALEDMKQGSHCNVCHHEGTMTKHKKGCSMCLPDCVCKSRPKDSLENACICNFHSMKAKITPYQIELEVRESALKKDDFPSNEVSNNVRQGLNNSFSSPAMHGSPEHKGAMK